VEMVISSARTVAPAPGVTFRLSANPFHPAQVVTVAIWFFVTIVM
jgi:hypothetical protein